MLNHFYFNDAIFNYGFGESHPLKPERLYRMFALLDEFATYYKTSARLATRADLLTVHTADYVDAVQQIDEALLAGRDDTVGELRTQFGFWGDNPAFPGMFEAACAYVGATSAAARAVANGAPIAYGIGGGLHHALADRASGFCIFNDCAIACSILRETFERVAYVDIDVHHGDGVQWIFYKDPQVLTCSIHEDGRTLWPGTGSVNETGIDFTSLNVPVVADTTRDVWLNAFEQTILPALKAWKPDAIVLQMGADTHHLDPLAHIFSDQSAWLKAVMRVQGLGVPTVVLGGGGYNLTTVPRMWTSAILSLADIPYPDEIPIHLQRRLGAATFSDPTYPCGARAGQAEAQSVIDHLTTHHLPHLKPA
jgi:acetoin utilization protein AcuC